MYSKADSSAKAANDEDSEKKTSVVSCEVGGYDNT
jgi:hypothetical protein